MGQLKEATAGASASRSGAWLDVSTRRRCPVCDSDSWCQIARDGATVLCKRVASARSKTNRDGVEFFVHWRGGGPSKPTTHDDVAPSPQRAGVLVLDAAYRATLGALELSAADRDALRRRGLTDDAIDRAAYRTLPTRGRAELARVVLRTVGETMGAAVPGIVRREDCGRSWWSFAGFAGLLIPVRDDAGSVVALKVRRPDPCERGARYRYVTSSRDGGPSALCAAHVPVGAAGLPRDLVTVTEGELKADVATCLLGRPVLSVPGAGSWRHVVDMLTRWGVARVELAFDMDRETNAMVARADADMTAALRALGVEVDTRRWDARWKGLDDFLAACARGETRAAT